MKKLFPIFFLLPFLLVMSFTALATAPITGSPVMCVGTQTALFDATPSGIWSSSNASVATVGISSGIVTGVSIGTATISYNVSGISAVLVVSVNAAPIFGAITGPSVVCVGSVINLTDPAPGGVWSVGSSSVASVDGAGHVTGVGVGGVTTISYSVSNASCTASALHVITVNPVPNAGTILGAGTVCAGDTLYLTDAVASGVWSTSAAGVATVTPSTGIVTGLSSGVANISYTVTNSFGCVTSAVAAVRVNPAPITGYPTICAGNITDLEDASPGGTWSSSNTSIANVDSLSGVVAGVAAGTVLITYKLTATPASCYVTTVITVQPPLSPITGATTICAGHPTTLVNATSGGTWTSGVPSIATVGLTSGVVNGLASGDTYITYSLNPGCITVTIMSINALPPAYNVTGTGSYCDGGAGLPIGLNGSNTGFTYNLYSTASLVASLPGTGSPLNFGVHPAGVYSVLATNNTSGCFVYMLGGAVITEISMTSPTVSILAAPGTTVCQGTGVLFTASSTSGGPTPEYHWSVNGISAGLTGSTFVYTPNDQDSVSVLLKSNAACVSPDSASTFVKMTVNAVLTPSVTITVNPGDSVCPGTPVTFTAHPANGGSAPAFRWMKNGIFATTGTTYTYTPVNGDNIFCTLQSSYVCPLVASIPSANSINMNVPPMYLPIVTVTAFPSNRVSFGDPVTFTAAVSFAGISYSYQWEVNSFPIPGANANTYMSSTINNLDIVTCVVTGLNICGTTEGSGQIQIFDTVVTAITNVQAGLSDIQLIPNPNKGTFTVKGSFGSIANEATTITITDMMGKVVYKEQTTTHAGKLDAQVQQTSALASGVYMLNVSCETANKVFHFVVE